MHIEPSRSPGFASIGPSDPGTLTSLLSLSLLIRKMGITTPSSECCWDEKLCVKAVLVTYCYMTNFPKTQWLKATVSTCLTISEDREFRSGFAGRLWVGLLHGFSQTSAVGPSMADKLVLAHGRRPQLLPTWASPQDCYSVLGARCLASLRASNSRDQGRSRHAFYDLASEAAHHHLCCYRP